MRRPVMTRLHGLSCAALAPQRRRWIQRVADGLRDAYPSPLGAGMDCVWLLERMEQSGRYPRVRLRLMDGLYTAHNVEALSVYQTGSGRHLILMDRSRLQYPFQTPAQRRANFTLAHELGHVMLAHADLPDQAKDPALLSSQEREADEFAGCLLMPARLLIRCQLHDAPRAAAFWQVTPAALWQRLNNLGRLDLLSPAQRPRPCCPTCGNVRFNLWQSRYCAVCGCEIVKRPFGVLPTTYTQGEGGNACTGCGRPLPGFARHCDLCAAPTTRFAAGLLKPWQLAQQADAVQPGTSPAADACKNAPQGTALH